MCLAMVLNRRFALEIPSILFDLNLVFETRGLINSPLTSLVQT